jgi:hypothetical protein
MLSFGVLIDAAGLALSTSWCWAMSKRWRRDFEELQDPASVSKCMIIAGLWGVTCVALCIVIGTSIGLVRGIAAAF